MGEITRVDDYTVNGVADTVELMLRRVGNSQPLILSTTTRQRADFHPAYEVGSYQPLEQMFEVTALAGNTLDEEAFSQLVYGLFLPSSEERVLEADFGGVTYTIRARVTSFGWVNFFQWQGTFQFLDPFWHAATETVATTSPVTITGNVLALPKLTITGGQAVTRQRVTVTDRTGHGIGAYLIAVTPAVTLGLVEASYRIHANGLEIPFAYEGGKLYFRVDCGPPPERTFVDIHMGASIDNSTVYAGGLDRSGTILTAFSAAYVTSAFTDAGGNPLAPSLAWHPTVTGSHDSSRPYGFTLNGDAIELINTDLTGQRQSPLGDVDSFVMVTGVEAERIRNLSMTVFSGYQRSVHQAASGVTKRVIKVMIGDANGEFPTGPVIDSPYPFYAGGRHPTVPYYAQFSMGGITFPNTRIIREYVDEPSGFGTFYTNQLWADDYLPSEFGVLASQFIGCTVTTGGTGVWYLSFDDDAYNGGEIPDITMSIQPKSGTFRAATFISPAGGYFIDEAIGDNALDNVITLQTERVNPDTLEPLDDDPDSADLPPNPLRGQIRVVVRKYVRDSPYPITVWEDVVTGARPSGSTVTYTGLSVETPGAVAIAVGVEPVAAKPSFVDWGILNVTSVPVVDLDASKTPSVVVSAAIPALHIGSGVIRNTATGATLTLTDYLADSNGLEIETSELTIGGAAGVGVVYGTLGTNKGVRLFNLVPGANNYTVTGDIAEADVEISFSERLAV